MLPPCVILMNSNTPLEGTMPRSTVTWDPDIHRLGRQLHQDLTAIVTAHLQIQLLRKAVLVLR
jgi:hypothetical protein